MKKKFRIIELVLLLTTSIWMATSHSQESDLRINKDLIKPQGRHDLNVIDTSILRTPKKVCHLPDRGRLTKCKRPDQIEDDLSTFLPQHIVAEILQWLEDQYHDLGLDTGKGILTQCSGTFIAVSVQDSPNIAVAESKHRSVLTEEESASIFAACLDANKGSLAGTPSGAPNHDEQHQQMVSKAKAVGDGQIAQCNERESRTSNSHLEKGGLKDHLQDMLKEVVSGAAVEAGSKAYDNKKAGEDKKEDWKDDGYDPWTQVEPGVRRREKVGTNGRIYDIEKTRGHETTYTRVSPSPKYGGTISSTAHYSHGKKTHTTVVETDGAGNIKAERVYDKKDRLMRETVHQDGGNSVTTVYEYPDEESKEYNATSIDQDGKVVDVKTSSTSSGASPGSPPGGGVDQPSEDAITCADIAAAWEAFKARCDQSNWNSYECQQYIRMSNSCVDAALIIPTPDGDFTCKSNPTLDLRKYECERKKGIEQPGDDGRSSSCDPPKGNLDEHKPSVQDRSIPTDVCRDPRAHQCNPESMVP